MLPVVQFKVTIENVITGELMVVEFDASADRSYGGTEIKQEDVARLVKGADADALTLGLWSLEADVEGYVNDLDDESDDDDSDDDEPPPKAAPEPDDTWYPLDGSVHASVAKKLSAVHLLGAGSDDALCRPGKLVLHTNDGMSAEDAVREGRVVCKECKRMQERTREDA